MAKVTEARYQPTFRSKLFYPRLSFINSSWDILSGNYYRKYSISEKFLRSLPALVFICIITALPLLFFKAMQLIILWYLEQAQRWGMLFIIPSIGVLFIAIYLVWQRTKGIRIKLRRIMSQREEWQGEVIETVRILFKILMTPGVSVRRIILAPAILIFGLLTLQALKNHEAF